jgi:putative copper export protein
MSGDTVADALLIASRLLWYAGFLGVIGTSAFRMLVSRAAGLAAADLDRAAATTGVVAAAVLLGGVFARLYAQAYVSFGLEEPVTAALLLDVATALPPWSTGWMQQVAAGTISVAALVAARTGVRLGWFLAHAAAVAVAASVPFTAHAVAQEHSSLLAMVLHGSHVLGAGVWIGGLFVLLLVGVARAVRQPAIRPNAVAALVNAFSPLGLFGAGLLTLSGAGMAFLYVNSIPDLWTTAYGRTLVVKVAMFGSVALVGFVNWQRVRPRLTQAGGAEVLRRTAIVELLFAGAVLAATALLVGLPQPAE